MIPMKLERIDEFTAASTAFKRAFDNAEKVDRSFQVLNLHDGIARDAESIGAEIVVAQYLNIKDFEPTSGTFKREADVASCIEVKHTAYKNGHLIIKDSDRNQDIAVLVVGKSPQYWIVGWIPVAIAKKDKYRHSKSDSWWVSQINLQPIETLRKSQYGNAQL